MRQDVAERWVKELRSGGRLQAKAALKTRDPHDKSRHCCLGVLCEIEGLKSKLNDVENVYVYDGEAAYLPLWLRDKVGLSGESESFLQRMNDEGKDFQHIADYIEKNWYLL